MSMRGNFATRFSGNTEMMRTLAASGADVNEPISGLAVPCRSFSSEMNDTEPVSARECVLRGTPEPSKKVCHRVGTHVIFSCGMFCVGVSLTGAHEGLSLFGSKLRHTLLVDMPLNVFVRQLLLHGSVSLCLNHIPSNN